MPEQTFTPLTPELLYLLSSDPSELSDTVAPFRGADVAESLNRMPPAAAAKVITNLPFDRAVEVLDEPELEAGTEIIGKMDRDVAGALLEEVAADRRADFLRQLPTRRRKRILDIIAEPTRSELTTLLKYPRGTAGGLMTTEVLEVPSNVTVHDAIERAKAEAQHHQTLYVLYVTEVASGKLLRALTLQDLLVADPKDKITEVGDQRPPLYVHPEANQDDVARLISKYNLLALPVVDKDHRVLGVITVDDMIDEMVRETTEDVQKFGGMEALGQPYLRVSLGTMIRKRAGWLSALFLGEMLTATAMGYFEGEIARAVVLSLFIPLIISSGGNSGSQATSLIIRAMALQEIRLRDWWRVAVRELSTGIALGVILGGIGIVRVLIWQHIGWYNYGPHALLIALTMGTALVGVVTFGVLAGSLLPFVLKRIGFDPASASAPFVATLVDVTGLVIYFSVAFLILRGTLL